MHILVLTRPKHAKSKEEMGELFPLLQHAFLVSLRLPQKFHEKRHVSAKRHQQLRHRLYMASMGVPRTT